MHAEPSLPRGPEDEDADPVGDGRSDAELAEHLPKPAQPNPAPDLPLPPDLPQDPPPDQPLDPDPAKRPIGRRDAPGHSEGGGDDGSAEVPDAVARSRWRR